MPDNRLDTIQSLSRLVQKAAEELAFLAGHTVKTPEDKQVLNEHVENLGWYYRDVVAASMQVRVDE